MPKLCLLFSALLLATACATTGAEQQTLVAHEAQIGTALDTLYFTATAEAERVLVTVEHVDQRIAAIGTQTRFTLLTLEARGIVVNDLPAPLSPTPQAGATTAPTLPGLAGQPIATINPNASPTSVEVTPFRVPTLTPLPTVAVVVDTPQILTEISLASQVGNDDCAVNPSSTFSPDTQEIYIIARAIEMPEGTTLTTRWYRGETELVTFDYTYDLVEDACIWFYADQSNFEFVPGDYSIIVEINGVSFGQPISFTITDSA